MIIIGVLFEPKTCFETIEGDDVVSTKNDQNASSLTADDFMEKLLHVIERVKSAFVWTKNAFSSIYDYHFGQDSVTFCKNWHSNQPTDEQIEEILNGLPPCWPRVQFKDEQQRFPAKLGVLVPDKGCKQHPTLLESIFQILLGSNCNYHPGATACFRSKPPGENKPRQQCCYSANGTLLVGPPGGGTLDMYSNFFDHYLYDVISYKSCCVKSNNCELYYEKRPSDSGQKWQPNELELAEDESNTSVVLKNIFGHLWISLLSLTLLTLFFI